MYESILQTTDIRDRSNNSYAEDCIRYKLQTSIRFNYQLGLEAINNYLCLKICRFDKNVCRWVNNNGKTKVKFCIFRSRMFRCYWYRRTPIKILMWIFEVMSFVASPCPILQAVLLCIFSKVNIINILKEIWGGCVGQYNFVKNVKF